MCSVRINRQKITAAESFSCRFSVFGKESGGTKASQPVADATDFFWPRGYTCFTNRGGEAVTVYLDLVVLLNIAVDLLLLAGTNRLSGFPVLWGRTALAAALGGVYAGCCLLPGFRFLGNLLWRTVSLGLMGAIAFGISRSAVRRSLLFVLLAMALGGVAVSLGTGGISGVLAGAAVLFFLCGAGFRGAPGPYPERRRTSRRRSFQRQGSA